MKHLTIFEKYGMTIREKLLNDATLYIEAEQPISIEDGLSEVVYSEHDDGVYMSFYYKTWVEEDLLDKVYKFLQDNKLKIISEEWHSDIFEIIIKLSENKIKEYAMLYTANKYNL